MVVLWAWIFDLWFVLTSMWLMFVIHRGWRITEEDEGVSAVCEGEEGVSAVCEGVERRERGKKGD